MGFSSDIATVLVKTGLLFARLSFEYIKFGGANMKEICFNYFMELVELGATACLGVKSYPLFKTCNEDKIS